MVENEGEIGELGVPASPSGCQPSASAAPLRSASSQSGIPNAGMFGFTVYASCPICYGSRVAFDGPCGTCADPDPVLARKVLERLTQGQMAFLRAYGHTLAQQPVTAAEDNAHRCELFVEDDDGVFDEQAEDWLIPNTKHWIAGGMARFGPGGEARFIQYRPLGLLLRECIMAGAAALVSHQVPAQAIEARRAATGTGAVEDESAVPKGCAQDTSPNISASKAEGL